MTSPLVTPTSLQGNNTQPSTVRSLRQRFSISRTVPAPSAVSSTTSVAPNTLAHQQYFGSVHDNHGHSSSPIMPPKDVSAPKPKRGFFPFGKGRRTSISNFNPTPANDTIESIDSSTVRGSPQAVDQRMATYPVMTDMVWQAPALPDGRLPDQRAISPASYASRNTLDIPRPTSHVQFPLVYEMNSPNESQRHPDPRIRPNSPMYVSIPAGFLPSQVYYGPVSPGYLPSPGMISPPLTPLIPGQAGGSSTSDGSAHASDQQWSLSEMRETMLRMQAMIQSAEVARSQADQAEPPAHAESPDPETTPSNKRTGHIRPIAVTLTPSSPSPPRPNPNGKNDLPSRSFTDPLIQRPRPSARDGEVLFARAISPLAAQRSSMESTVERSLSPVLTRPSSPGVPIRTRPLSPGNETSAIGLDRSTTALSWRERVAQRRMERERDRQAHQTHSRTGSGISEYYSVRARSTSLSTQEEARSSSRLSNDPEPERDRPPSRTTDWLGSGTQRAAFRAAGLLDNVDKNKEKERGPPVSGSRTSRRGRHTPSTSISGNGGGRQASRTHSRADSRTDFRADSRADSVMSRSVADTPPPSATPSATAGTTVSTSTTSSPPSPSALAQVFELHNLEKEALLGALQEARRREREREEEVHTLRRELQTLVGRVKELEALLKARHGGGEAKKSRLPLPVQRDRLGSKSPSYDQMKRSSTDTFILTPPSSETNVGAPHSTPSRANSASPTMYLPEPPSRELYTQSTLAAPASPASSDSESLRLRTEDEQHLQEFVDVDFGAGNESDESSF